MKKAVMFLLVISIVAALAFLPVGGFIIQAEAFGDPWGDLGRAFDDLGRAVQQERANRFWGMMTPIIVIAVVIIVVTIIIVVAVNASKRKKERRRFQETQREFQEAPKSNNASNADELIKLKKLLDEGILTQAEFDAKKRELL